MQVARDVLQMNANVSLNDAGRNPESVESPFVGNEYFSVLY